MLNPYQSKRQFASLRKHLWHLIELAEVLREFEGPIEDMSLNGITFTRAERTEHGARLHYEVLHRQFILELAVSEPGGSGDPA